MYEIRFPDLIFAFMYFMDLAAGMNGFRRIVCLNSTIQMFKDKRNWPNSIVPRIRKVCVQFFLNVVAYAFRYQFFRGKSYINEILELILLCSASIEAKETGHAYSIQR